MSRRPGVGARFLAPAAEARAEIREKGSRFLAVVRPVADDDAVTAALRDLRSEYPDATHHCWASRLGWPARERSADDGEPAGTAGRPILQVLAGREVSDALVVVVRWFGGTKLGKGGLARAYAAATGAALETARLTERFPTVVVSVVVPYERLGGIKRLLRPPEVELEAERYGERVELDIRVAEEVLPDVEEALADFGIVPD